MQEWHATLRERLTITRKGNHYNEKWGRFPPEFRFNIDQSPCLFVLDSNRIYYQFTKKQHNQKVWMPGAGLGKAHYSLQICFRPQGKQPSHQKMDALPRTKM